MISSVICSPEGALSNPLVCPSSGGNGGALAYTKDAGGQAAPPEIARRDLTARRVVITITSDESVMKEDGLLHNFQQTKAWFQACNALNGRSQSRWDDGLSVIAVDLVPAEA